MAQEELAVEVMLEILVLLDRLIQVEAAAQKLVVVVLALSLFVILVTKELLVVP
jgi:hypothetical protein